MKRISDPNCIASRPRPELDATIDHASQEPTTFRPYVELASSRGGGGHTSILLTGMLVREQISITQKSRMTPNSNPKK